MSTKGWGWPALALLAAAIAGFPWLGDLIGERFPTSYELRLVMRVMILAIVVIGLNLLVGLAGLVSLGQAALYGLGAHVAALLVALSRVFIGTHYASDVLGGALTGAVAAMLVARLYQRGTRVDRFVTSVL